MTAISAPSFETCHIRSSAELAELLAQEPPRLPGAVPLPAFLLRPVPLPLPHDSDGGQE